MRRGQCVLLNTESFTYDPTGNRTQLTLNGNPISYSYDSDDELQSAGTNSYTYNADGDQITRTIGGVTSNLSYNDADQLVSIATGSNTTSFAYDAIGRRVARASGNTTTDFWYDGGNVILESQGGTFTGTYTYGASLIRRNGEYFQYDGLGSTRTITNSSGSQTASAIYDGYGNTVATSGSTSSPYLFAATSGYRNDNDDGLMLVGARYYDPAVGEFITRDTLLSQPPYQYCNDDPVNKVDPSGQVSWSDVGGIVGGIVGGAIGYVIAGPPGAWYGSSIGAGLGAGLGTYYGDGGSVGSSIGEGVVVGGGTFITYPAIPALGTFLRSGVSAEELEALAAFLTRMFNSRPPFGLH